MPKAKAELPAQTASPVNLMAPRPGSPQAKLRDVEVTITEENAHLFIGKKIVGFTLWDNGPEGIGVQLPNRPFKVNGERRSFSLLRSASGDPTDLDPLKQYLVDAYTATLPLAE
jgi:hypothetical protein